MHRGKLTDLLLAAVQASGLPIGDGEPPKEGGWPQGTPNVGSHIPFSVLEAGPASGMSRNVSGGNTKDFLAQYTLSTYAVRRNTCDELAWRVRKRIVGITPVEFEGFKAAHATITTIGGVRKTSQVQPDLWTQVDAFEVYCVPLR